MLRASSILILCILAAGCSQRPPDPRGLARGEVLLQVTATGRADTRPDEARFTAGVETIAASAADASARNSATINRVIAAVERLGVKPDDVQTRSITLSRIDYGPNRGRYQANNMIEVRVRDLKRAGEAIAATTDAGANVLSGPNLSISDPEAAGRSAYAQAYKAARARAETYAQAAGLKLVRVLAIRDGGAYGPPPPPRDAVMQEQAAVQVSAPPPLVRAGIDTAVVQVAADFALAPQ